MPPDGGGAVGVHVTLREIYDATQRAARTADGTRNDVQSMRRDIKALSGRVAAVEKQLQGAGAPAYLKRAGYVVGLLAAGAASGWAAVKGG